MWRKLTYRQKVLYWGAGLLLVCVLGYQFSFSKTIKLYKENQALEQLTQKNQTELIHEIARASVKKKKIDSLMLLVEQNASVSGLISSLLNLAEHHNLMVSGINDKKKMDGDEFFYYFQFSGMYVNMIRFLRSVERDIISLNIVSVDFNKVVDRRTAEERLFLNLTLSKPVGNE